MLKRFRKRNEGIGIDLSGGAIQLARVRRTGDRVVLMDSFREPIPLSSLEPPELSAMEAPLIRLVQQTGIQKKSVSLALDPGIVTIRDIRIPVVPDEELFQVVGWEIQKHTDYDELEHNLDFIIQNRDHAESGGKYEVMVVVARKTDLKQRALLLEKAGLRCSRMGIPADAIRSVISAIPGVQPDLNAAIVDLGLFTTQVTILQGTALRLTRQLNFSIASAAHELADQMGTNPEQALALISRTPLHAQVSDPETRQNALVVIPIMERLAVELNRSFNFYSSVSRGQTVDRVYLSGHYGHLPGLEAFMLEQLGVTARLLDPLEAVTPAGSRPDHPYRLTVAIGMGMMP